MSAVVARSLSRRYGRRFALSEVSLDLPRGSCVMLAGRNGAGKSTLLRVLAGALRPDRGEVSVLGRDVRTDPEGVRTETTLLGHRTFLYEPLTAAENLGLHSRLLGHGGARGPLMDRLREVGLDERADDPVSTFSAGMRQRLALARVLLKDAELVLLDEPYGHLDPPGFRLVDRVLERLRGQGRTVIVATHLIARGRAHCDRALLLEAGRIAYSGPILDMPPLPDETGTAEGGS
jgi:heme ABC exporter ATP-binding subunit CcmA